MTLPRNEDVVGRTALLAAVAEEAATRRPVGEASAASDRASAIIRASLAVEPTSTAGPDPVPVSRMSRLGATGEPDHLPPLGLAVAIVGISVAILAGAYILTGRDTPFAKLPKPRAPVVADVVGFEAASLRDASAAGGAGVAILGNPRLPAPIAELTSGRIAMAHELLGQGQVARARQLLSDHEDSDSLALLGQTFDRNFLASVQLPLDEADALRAANFYSRAIALGMGAGVEVARERLERLQR
jgi:hypothetical protein